MNMKENRGKTPLEQRQERIEKLREIAKANQGKTSEQIKQLFIDYLLSQGLSWKTTREYLEMMSYVQH